MTLSVSYGVVFAKMILPDVIVYVLYLTLTGWSPLHSVLP